MKKVMICLTGCFLLAVTTGQAQVNTPPATDSTRPAMDTTVNAGDTTIRFRPPVITDSTAPKDSSANALPKDNALAKDNTPAIDKAQAKDSSVAKTDGNRKTQDTSSTEKQETVRQLDTRWFISPLLKLQFQDFAMLEKNREGYLSNANTLSFFQRGNASFAASAYKNITARFSISGDLGLSFGHVTNNNTQISQTQSKTYNLLNASVYYHLLPASFPLQPYLTVGINDVISDASYVSLPMGVGAKFNSRKIMVLGQITYGYAVGKNIANTTMYSMGVYIPINSKKKKQLEADDTSPYNRPGKDDAKKKDKDSTAGKNGTVINNIYVTINMDSVLRAKGLLNDDGSPNTGGGSGRRTGNGGNDDEGSGGSGSRGHRRRGLHNFDVDDFSNSDFRMDSLDGRPVIRFVVYFEFNEYGLTSQGFGKYRQSDQPPEKDAQ